MIDEGYVKFLATWRKGPAPERIEELIDVRNELHRLGLVGEYADSKIGYGNVSQRLGTGKQFIISGSATGGLATATSHEFCRVTAYDIAQNTVECIGPVTASSESLTHAMLYECSDEIGAILHVHHRSFWEKLLGAGPTTAADVPYGTPEMAREMARLMTSSDLPTIRLLAMAGHPEGIIAFGSNVQEAKEKILLKFADMENFGK